MSGQKKLPETADPYAELMRLRAERAAKSPEQRKEEERLWKLENAEAFESMNAWVEEHSLPLARFRLY